MRLSRRVALTTGIAMTAGVTLVLASLALLLPRSLSSLINRKEISAITYVNGQGEYFLPSEAYDDFFVSLKEIKFQVQYGPTCNCISSYSLKLYYIDGHKGLINGYYYNLNLFGDQSATAIKFVQGDISNLAHFFAL
ncbi:MAG: hypothetical protein LKE36_00435 [Bacilli bacterium]|jgi:hypothetical protein|nr:hypothetical protein [Bacilli bacterium]